MKHLLLQPHFLSLSRKPTPPLSLSLSFSLSLSLSLYLFIYTYTPGVYIYSTPYIYDIILLPPSLPPAPPVIYFLFLIKIIISCSCCGYRGRKLPNSARKVPSVRADAILQALKGKWRLIQPIKQAQSNLYVLYDHEEGGGEKVIIWKLEWNGASAARVLSTRILA